ncbi:hypothetical protein BurMR1_0578 [Burkholderia sp. MR1]|nr:hypothetical protein BurMR1_0578 [Burkholderia sp. MR1]
MIIPSSQRNLKRSEHQRILLLSLGLCAHVEARRGQRSPIGRGAASRGVPLRIDSRLASASRVRVSSAQARRYRYCRHFAYQATACDCVIIDPFRHAVSGLNYRFVSRLRSIQGLLVILSERHGFSTANHETAPTNQEAGNAIRIILYGPACGRDKVDYLFHGPSVQVDSIRIVLNEVGERDFG